MANRETRYRNFVAIGYPESLVSNWKDILNNTHLQIVISPLHDKDLTLEGEEKKAHYHILLMYDAPHTTQQAQNLYDSIGATHCQVVNSLRGQARYLLHLDNQDKHQYKISDIECLNGVDFPSLIELPTDNYKAVRDMMMWVNENDCSSYFQLLTYAANNNETWFRALINSYTMVMKEYIKSRWWDLYQRTEGGHSNTPKR